jgi:ketosteroid isomerase-like protein
LSSLFGTNGPESFEIPKEAMMSYSSQEQANLDTVKAALMASKGDFVKFFDLFEEDVEWTLAGHGPVAGTYNSKTELFEKAEKALFARFAEPLKINTRGVWADGDEVFARIESATTAIDGRPYRNSYMYIMTMDNGRVVSGIEWLDFHAYYEILDRVKIGPES